jgi:hypothetical protein
MHRTGIIHEKIDKKEEKNISVLFFPSFLSLNLFDGLLATTRTRTVGEDMTA